MPILVPALAVGSTLAVRTAAAAVRGSGGPTDEAALLLFEASAWSVAAMAGGLIVGDPT